MTAALDLLADLGDDAALVGADGAERLEVALAGWVTTTFSSSKIFPPPTGISEVLARPEALPPLPPLSVPPLLLPPSPPLSLPPLPLLLSSDPHAARSGVLTPRPTMPPTSVRRRAPRAALRSESVI